MTNDPGAIYIPEPAWSQRATGKTCAYLPNFGGIDSPRRRTSGLKVYRTRRLAAHARVYQIAAHALGLAPPVRSTIVEVRIAGQARKRWGYITAHATSVGAISKAAIRRWCERADRLGLAVGDNHRHNFGRYDNRWVRIDFAHPED